MTIAIVGTGLAAYGVATSLLSAPEPPSDIVLIGPDPPQPPFALGGRDPRTWTDAETDSLHRELRGQAGFAFPPPSSRGGRVLEDVPGAGGVALSRSAFFGGFGQYWSASVYPFTERNLADWPVARADLDPFYRSIAGDIGVAAEANGLDSYFGDTFATLPPVRPTGLVRRLIDAVESRRERGETPLMAGVNRIALDTRPESPASCVSCGGCHYGCFRGALFAPGAALRRLEAAGRLSFRSATVRAVSANPDGGHDLQMADGSSVTAERVYLCAGAVASSTILMRSLDLTGTDVFIDDNEMYSLALVNTGRGVAADDEFFALANAIIGGAPDDDGIYSQVHVAPVPDYLLGYYVPARWARRLSPLTRALRRRVLLARLVTDGAVASRYALRLDAAGEVSVRRVRQGASAFRARRFARALRAALKGSGIAVAPLPLMRSPTSWHYVGGFGHPPAGVTLRDGYEVRPGFYVADSATFPAAPAQSLGFTIMANAARIVAATTP